MSDVIIDFGESAHINSYRCALHVVGGLDLRRDVARR